MRSLPTAYIAKMNKRISSDAWVWLLQIQVDADTDDGFFLTTNTEEVTFDSVVYDPYPVRVKGFGEDDLGSIKPVSIEIEDISLEIMPYVLSSGGLTGNVVSLKLVNLDAGLTDAFELELQIARARYDSRTLTLEAIPGNLFPAEFPSARYLRDFCQWQFLSTECGVDASVPGPGETCTKRLQGTFGCEYWGDQEVLAAFPRNHPKRYGGFPSLISGITFEV